MKFSIVTPSFCSGAWLKLCIASVADQKGVEHEHIIQDSCSDDGTQNWLPNDQRVRAFIEKDQGMYDAINRGYRRASGEILAYLNCDEQYLPGGLKIIHDFFESHPKADVVLAGTIVSNPDGSYVCHRHALVPQSLGIWVRFPVLTSSVFLRRSVVHQRGIWFNTHWRDHGDFHWFRELIKQHIPMAVCDACTSVFTDTGDNMNLKPNALREQAEKLAMMPLAARWLKPFWVLHHRARRLAAGHFRLAPTSYSIYTLNSPSRRMRFDVPRPTAVWWRRLSMSRLIGID